MLNIVKKNVGTLVAHPMNKVIYGTDNGIFELKKAILKSKKVERIVVTSQNVIISGCRRALACKELVNEGNKEFEEIECEVRDFESADEEVAYLIRCNCDRDKTIEQKIREIKAMFEIEDRQKIGEENANCTNSGVNDLDDDALISDEFFSRYCGGVDWVKNANELEIAFDVIDTIDEWVKYGIKFYAAPGIFYGDNYYDDDDGGLSDPGVPCAFYEKDDCAVEFIRYVLNKGYICEADTFSDHIEDISNYMREDVMSGEISIEELLYKMEELDYEYLGEEDDDDDYIEDDEDYMDDI